MQRFERIEEFKIKEHTNKQQEYLEKQKRDIEKHKAIQEQIDNMMK